MTRRVFIVSCLVLMGACGDDALQFNRQWGKQDRTGKRDWSLMVQAKATEAWTIECVMFDDADRAQTTERLASALERVRQIRPSEVRVSHEDNRSQLFYGSYDLKYVDGKIKFSPALNSDLKFIRSLSFQGSFPFFSARPLPVPIEDTGPPEWDLGNAKGMYTLHVGVTYNDEGLHDYKTAAVDWVRVLRGDGFEAYYYHHPDRPKSDVCVGTFGPEALVADRPDSHRYDEEVLRLQSQADFRWNLENGHRVIRNGMANQSFLVLIPRPENLDKRLRTRRPAG